MNLATWLCQRLNPDDHWGVVGHYHTLSDTVGMLIVHICISCYRHNCTMVHLMQSPWANHTEGLGNFWRGCTSRTEKGFELSLLSVVDLNANTAYALEAKQTLDQKGKTRVDLYAEQVFVLALTLRQKKQK